MYAAELRAQSAVEMQARLFAAVWNSLAKMSQAQRIAALALAAQSLARIYAFAGLPPQYVVALAQQAIEDEFLADVFPEDPSLSIWFAA